MNMSELRGKDSRELRLDVQDLLKEQFQMRFKAANEEVANTARFGHIRRIVAQINTVLREREIAAQQTATKQTAAQKTEV